MNMSSTNTQFFNEIKCHNPLINDLVNLAREIYIQDILTRNNINDRSLFVTVAVSDVTKWNKQKSLLTKLIKFMSHDNLNLNFTTETTHSFYIQQEIEFAKPNFDAVTLLSGGLDSLCGVNYNLEHNIKSIYCSYKLNKFESKSLNTITKYLKEKHKTAHFTFSNINIKKVVNTQRTRSFLFLSLACACADLYHIKNVNLYENGIMSLNPGLKSRTPTRTTHPNTIKMINELLDNLNVDIKINHPFLFLTKGEMINNISDEFKNLIKHTNTCGMSRQNKKLVIRTGHCGSCVPCLLRKISLSAYDNEAYDAEYDIPYNIKFIAKKPLYKDYISSYYYYFDFYKRIKDATIFYELDIKRKYYEMDNYITKTQDMLLKFSKELETFFNKYPL